MGVVDSIADVAKQGIDKITSDKEILQEANEILKNSSVVDINNQKINNLPKNNVNMKNCRFWLELICIIGFGYTYLLVPIINDIEHLIKGTELTGVASQNSLDNMLFALLGLGGYRLAEKAINKTK